MSLSRVESRVVDACVMQGVQPSGDVPVVLSLGPAVGGNQAAGIQRLAQQFLSLFLMEQGSCFFDLERGTDFLVRLRSGQLYSDAEVTSSFQLAASDVLDYMQREFTDDTPDDERLTNITLLWFELRPPKLLLGIKLETAAGTSRAIILPAS